MNILIIRAMGSGIVTHNVFRYICYFGSIIEYDENAEYENGGYKIWENFSGLSIKILNISFMSQVNITQIKSVRYW